MSTYLIYGAYGYTGTLLAEEAARRGHRPILAGRDREATLGLAGRLGLTARVFPLDPAEIDAALEDVSAVLHCAGPFSRTYRPMVEACFRTKTHYLDIAGEPAVFEGLSALDRGARQAQVMVLPGVGFDVVPTDCLAAHLKARLPSATRLCLGLQVTGAPSRGTANAMIESLGDRGLVRKDGRLTPVPSGWKSRSIDFGRGLTHATTVPWGDVSSAYHSTGIGDIEVYLAVPRSARAVLRAMDYLSGFLRWDPVQGLLKRRVRSGQPGPTPEQRARFFSLLWGEACDDRGGRVESRLRVPEGYTCTVRTALAIMERVLKGEAPPGFQTPSRAYGSDFIAGIEGVITDWVKGS